MLYDLDTVNTILAVSKYVLGVKMQKYVNNLALGLKKPNDKSGCGCICGMKSLWQFIKQADYRKNEMYVLPDYQLMIANLFKCMSLQPEYYTYIGGGNVINATVPSGGGSTGGSGSYTDSMEVTPASGATQIPTSAEDRQKLAGADTIIVLREGVGMQNKDNTRPDYYSFDSTTGIVTIKTPANGDEIFTIIYDSVLITGSTVLPVNVDEVFTGDLSDL